MAKPAARLSDLNTCPKTGHGTNPATSGSSDVLINNLPTLRSEIPRPVGIRLSKASAAFW
ncbi:PAAR domain-containing protein [Stutzerimonas nitrititolerans]|uniref:PAAR domain-containing protein n=1 Tax=Stutzerimonas nitrititolerans TaxID=2482751 RepID=UPI0028ADA593|nr:PAAR domain-containing protein [Stutzerimonas nitrititolerans]